MIAWVLEITGDFQIIFAMQVQNNYPKFVGPCFMKGYGENWSRKHIKKKKNPLAVWGQNSHERILSLPPLFSKYFKR